MHDGRMSPSIIMPPHPRPGHQLPSGSVTHIAFVSGLAPRWLPPQRGQNATQDDHDREPHVPITMNRLDTVNYTAPPDRAGGIPS